MAKIKDSTGTSQFTIIPLWAVDEVGTYLQIERWLVTKPKAAFHD